MKCNFFSPKRRKYLLTCLYALRLSRQTSSTTKRGALNAALVSFPSAYRVHL